MALRGRFLVGSRPVSRDLVRRFVASAAESGIDVFRIHDPSNDLENLVEAAEAIRGAGKELAIGLVHSPGPERRRRRAPRARSSADRARRLSGAGPRPGRLPRSGAARAELVERVREASGLPVGLYCQGAAGAALAAAIEAARGGRGRHRLRDLPDRALHPPRLRGGTLAVALGDRARHRHRRCRPLACLRAGRRRSSETSRCRHSRRG